MRALTKSAVLAVAATVACTLPMGVAAAQTSPFGSLGSLGSSDPGPETPAPQVTVSKSAGLTNDEEITVTGTGFGRGGQGIYVALAQVDRYSNTDSSVFHSTKWIKPAQIVDGSFTTTLKATAIKGDANCYENACAIFTLADHNTLTDRSQDTQTPVTFAPPVVVPTPTVTANKTTNLVAGDTITVSGTGFQGAAAGTGIYYGIVQDDQFSTTNSAAWITTAFVTPAQIVDGSWTGSISATALKGTSNCYVNACSIRTVMAHGSTDRTQDTRTPIAFAPLPPANAVVDAPEIENAASVHSSSDSGLPIAPLAIGGAIAAGLAVTALRRRV